MLDYANMGPTLQLVGSRFLNFLLSNYHVTSNVAECRYYRTFKRPYFHNQSDMVGCAGSPICIVQADITLTRSKVKVKVMGR